ncbi:MAG: DUF2934 domain-containing protein [Bryobacterales bacterium]|nr:DUF2934 domain-containing protein [Bryobacterales bacterium]
MPTPFVQVIPFSDPAGLPLAGVVSQALESIRCRAFDLFEQRAPHEGSEFEDWLRAERELFEIPEAEVVENAANGGGVTVRFKTAASAAHPLTILVEPEAVTAMSFDDQGALTLLRRLNFTGPVDALRGTLETTGATVELSLSRQCAQSTAPLKAAAAAAAGGSTGLIAAA